MSTTLKSTTGLFGVAASERPKKHSEAVIRAAAEACWKGLASEPQYAKFDDDDIKGSIESIAKALDDDDDGYRICRTLSHDGWDVDAGLVEHMNGGWLDRAYDKAVIEWVRREGIVPRLSVGDRVTYQVSTGLLTNDPKSGVIARIETTRAYYVLTDGEKYPDDQTGGGWVKHFEDIETDAAVPV